MNCSRQVWTIDECQSRWPLTDCFIFTPTKRTKTSHHRYKLNKSWRTPIFTKNNFIWTINPLPSHTLDVCVRRPKMIRSFYKNQNREKNWRFITCCVIKNAAWTDPLVAFRGRLPGSAAPLWSLLCLLGGSSVLGRTPASRRMYPKESDILNQCFFVQKKRSSHSICDDSEERLSRYLMCLF